MATTPMRDALYDTLRAALHRPDYRIDRGSDSDPGPIAGLGTLLMLERRGWARLQRDTVTHPRTGQPAREISGGWLVAYGRAALRAEVTRRGDAMPRQLARPGDRPAPTPRASLTCQVDPFALVAAAGARPVGWPL